MAAAKKKAAARRAVRSPVDIEAEVKRRDAVRASMKHVRSTKKQDVLIDIANLQHSFRGNAEVSDKLQRIRDQVEGL